jgi:hypothetical protein
MDKKEQAIRLILMLDEQGSTVPGEVVKLALKTREQLLQAVEPAPVSKPRFAANPNPAPKPKVQVGDWATVYPEDQRNHPRNHLIVQIRNDRTGSIVGYAYTACGRLVSSFQTPSTKKDGTRSWDDCKVCARAAAKAAK